MCNTEENLLFLVSEYYQEGNLRRFLQENNLTDEQIAEMFAKILKGVLLLNGGAHGDLKLENVLISSEGTPHLTDFCLV